MKSKFIIATTLLSSFFCNAQYTWHSLPIAPISWRFDDCYFANPQVGWVINPNYDYLSPNQYGRIFKTVDGGTTWHILKDSSNTFFRSVGFADTLTGWVGNIADTLDTNSSGVRFTNDTIPLYETHDGGITWNPVNLPHPHPAGICGISVVTDSVIFAYGRFYGPAAYIKTTDKGTTWVYKDMTSQAWGIIDGHFFNKDTGYLTGMDTDRKAEILYTTDGGTTWVKTYHSTRADTDRVWKISFPSRSIGYATIEYGGSQYPYSTVYLKSTDGGLSWNEYPFFSTYDEEGIGFINDSVGWIGGDFQTGTYVTYNGGASWIIDPTFGISTPPYEITSAAYSINRFRAFGDTLMYASGNTIYKLNASTGIQGLQSVSQTPEYYPNPVHDVLYVTTAQNVVQQAYTITNMIGAVMSRGTLSAGSNHIDVGSFPSGVYILSCNAGNGQRVMRKFVKW